MLNEYYREAVLLLTILFLDNTGRVAVVCNNWIRGWIDESTEVQDWLAADLIAFGADGDDPEAKTVRLDRG